MNNMDAEYVVVFAESAIRDAVTADYDTKRMHLAWRLPQSFKHLTDTFNEVVVDERMTLDAKVELLGVIKNLTTRTIEVLNKAGITIPVKVNG